MIGDLFDSPWKILIVAAVIIVLFGSAKLPHAARSLGKSMRILKTEIKDLHEDDSTPPAPVAVVPPVAAVPAVAPPLAAVSPFTAQRAEQQIDELQRQLAALQGAAGEPVASQYPQHAG
jgi:sec-independent protein translocase protein TatA